MTERLMEAGLYALERAWVICATMVAIAGINLICAIAAPPVGPAHPERVVLKLN